MTGRMIQINRYFDDEDFSQLFMIECYKNSNFTIFVHSLDEPPALQRGLPYDGKIMVGA